MSYCAVVDLLIGDITPSAALDPAKYVNDAADEIDSKIGFRYATPVAVTAPRPVLLLLKRLNSHLASGRLILAATISGSSEQLNAYGADLVTSAQVTLEAIAAGEMYLPGAVASPTLPPAPLANDPSTYPLLHSNLDAVSQVESFYEAVTNPGNQGYFSNPYRAASSG